MKKLLILVFLYPFFGNNSIAKNQNREPKFQNHFYLGTGIGIEDFFIATPKIAYAVNLKIAKINPYLGVQASLLIPLVAVGINKSGYAVVDFKKFSAEIGIGRSSLSHEYGVRKFNYANYKVGIKTKDFWLKIGPTFVTNYFSNPDFVKRNLLRVHNQNWNVDLVFKIKK